MKIIDAFKRESNKKIAITTSTGMMREYAPRIAKVSFLNKKRKGRESSTAQNIVIQTEISINIIR